MLLSEIIRKIFQSKIVQIIFDGTVVI